MRTGMPGYLASKPRATRSDTGRSMAAYQTTLPSFLAASISAGVTAVGSGAWARAGLAKTVAAAPADALSRSRRFRIPAIAASSHAEQLGVTRLDLVGPLLDGLRILLHQLDVGELAHA